MAKAKQPKAKAPAPETTGEQRAKAAQGKPPVEHQFKPGNPGRPKGSRNKLGEAFVEALHADFDAHGAQVIADVREKDPAAYVRVVASLLPKEFKIETTSDLTDEQLDQRIRQLAAAIGLEVGTGVADGRATTAQGSQSTH